MPLLFVPIVSLLCVVLLAASPALAQVRSQAAANAPLTRVALVIGNNDYSQVPKLNNAAADAKSMAREFRELGFEVIEKINVDQRSMKAAVREFVRRVGNGGVGAFFYAGHGVQEGGNNYLLPVDVSKLTDSGALTDEAVELNSDVMARIGQAGAKFSLLVIDACRDNPFPRKAGRSVGGVRGLGATTETPEGMVVVYSAGVGQQALDKLDDNDRHPNGLFTRELVVELRKPGLEVAEMVRNVRQRVKEAAAKVKHEQTPAIYIQADRFYLVSPPLPAPPVLPSSEDAFWAQIDTDKPCEYLAYLDEYPSGKFAALARVRSRDCVLATRTKPTETVAMLKPPTPSEKPLSLAAETVPARKSESVKPEVTQPEAAPAARVEAPARTPPSAASTQPAAEALIIAPPAAREPAQSPVAATTGAGAATAASNKGKTPSKATPKAKPAPSKSSPFSSVPDSSASSPMPADRGSVSTSSFLELPLPAGAAASPKAAPTANPAAKASKPAQPTQLEIVPPSADRGTQIVMLDNIETATRPRRQVGPGESPDLRIGDLWLVQKVDLFTRNVIGSWSDRVHSVEGERVRIESASAISRSIATGLLDLDASTWYVQSPRVLTGRPIPLAFPLAVGKTWEYRYTRRRNDDQGETHYTVRARVAGMEKIETPAGAFDAFKVVHQKTYDTVQSGRNWGGSGEEVFWYAPEARRWVRHDIIDRSSSGRIVTQFREELVKLQLRS